MDSVLVIQHTAAENLGLIAGVLEQHGLMPEYIQVFRGQPVPVALSNSAALILLGGPMGVYEEREYPHLRDEKKLIELALGTDVPVLGICLGSQLLASVLGSDVRKGVAREIGWHEIKILDSTDRLMQGLPRTMDAFHWHGDIFNLPADCQLLASSAMTDVQAFRYRQNAYGLLCHLEVSRPLIESMMKAFPDEMEEAGLTEEAIRSQTSAALDHLHEAATSVFDHWVTLANKRTQFYKSV